VRVQPKTFFKKDKNKDCGRRRRVKTRQKIKKRQKRQDKKQRKRQRGVAGRIKSARQFYFKNSALSKKVKTSHSFSFSFSFFSLLLKWNF